MVDKVQILKTRYCSSCAKASELIEKIKADEGLSFEVEELDITEHSGLVQKYQLMTSPGIIIDGELEFAGRPSEKKLRERLVR